MAALDWIFAAVLLASMLIGAWRGLVFDVTAPVSANLMAQAALHLKVRSRAPLPPAVDPHQPQHTPPRRP